MRKINAILVIMILCLAMSCEGKERVYSDFMDDALSGVVVITDRDRYENGELVFSTLNKDVDGIRNCKYDPGNELIFYDNGTCRHCYYTGPIYGEPEVGYNFLYATFEWSVNKSDYTITLTDSQLSDKNDVKSIGKLKVVKYRNGKFKLSGTMPQNHNKDFSYNLYGEIFDADFRAEFENKYRNEKEYIE